MRVDIDERLTNCSDRYPGARPFMHLNAMIESR